MKYFLILFILSFKIYGQKNPGPRFVSMGSGGIAMQDVWAMQQNPAGITGMKRPVLALAFQRHLLDPDLSTQSAVFVFPHRRSAFGFSLERYGFDAYKEQQAGISYAMGFGHSLKLAIGVRYSQLSIVQYGSSNSFDVEAGFQFRITEKFTVASHLANPGGMRSGAGMPVRLSFGVLYTFTDRLVMITDVRKSFDYALDVMTGLEYKIVDWFSLRGGVSANPFKQYAGFGLEYRKVSIEGAVSSHITLGYTPQISLGYEF
ncbi:MAG: hypothetical protein ACO1NS_08660 [Daejeonella sp.]